MPVLATLLSNLLDCSRPLMRLSRPTLVSGALAKGKCARLLPLPPSPLDFLPSTDLFCLLYFTCFLRRPLKDRRPAMAVTDPMSNHYELLMMGLYGDDEEDLAADGEEFWQQCGHRSRSKCPRTSVGDSYSGLKFWEREHRHRQCQWPLQEEEVVHLQGME